MKRVYFVAVTSDAEHFEEIVAYATKEQAKEGLKLAYNWTKQSILDGGFEDLSENIGDDYFSISYNDNFCYYHGAIKYGVAFDEGEKVQPMKEYKVTTTKVILAYSEDDAIAMAKSDEPIDYDDEEKTTAELYER